MKQKLEGVFKVDNKSLREYMNKIGDMGLDQLGREVAREVMSYVYKKDEDSLTVTKTLAKQVFMDSFELHFESLYLDNATSIQSRELDEIFK